MSVMMAAVMLLLAGMTGAWAEEPSYIGYEGCKMCHRAQFADWERSAHARAFELLKPGKRSSVKRKGDLDPDKDYTNDNKCLKCHTTGFEAPGGFISVRLTATRIGVGCESCHGPGSIYREIHKAQRSTLKRDDVIAAGQVYGSIDAQVCRKCHEHEDMPFQPEIDDKYRFDHAARLQVVRSYHKSYR